MKKEVGHQILWWLTSFFLYFLYPVKAYWKKFLRKDQNDITKNV